MYKCFANWMQGELLEWIVIILIFAEVLVAAINTCPLYIFPGVRYLAQCARTGLGLLQRPIARRWVAGICVSFSVSGIVPHITKGGCHGGEIANGNVKRTG